MASLTTALRRAAPRAEAVRSLLPVAARRAYQGNLQDKVRRRCCHSFLGLLGMVDAFWVSGRCCSRFLAALVCLSPFERVRLIGTETQTQALAQAQRHRQTDRQTDKQTPAYGAFNCPSPHYARKYLLKRRSWSAAMPVHGLCVLWSARDRQTDRQAGR